MQIERQSVTGAEVLAVQGQLDATTAPQLEGALEDAADYGNGQPLIVDLAGVGLISSAALRVLLSAAKRARKESGKIHLCAANSEVRKVFEISGLAALFDLHDTREDALAATGAVTAAEPAPAPAAPVLSAAPEVVPPIAPPPAPTPEPPPAALAPPVPAAKMETEFMPVAPPVPPVPEPEAPAFVAPPPPPPVPVPPPIPAEPRPMTRPEPATPPPRAIAPPLPTFTPGAPAPPLVPPVPAAFPPTPGSDAEATAPVPPRAKSFAAPPPPAPARVPTRTPAPVSAPARRPFPLFPILAGVLGLGLVAAAAGYFLFNRFAPKTGLADVNPEPSAMPEQSATPSTEPSIVPMDATPTPEPTAATTPPPESSPVPTPTPALVGSASVTPAPTPPAAGGTEANRVAAPAQVNFDPADPRNASVRESVLKRIESMPVSRKVKDQLYAALERARGMGRVATITFGTGRTDLSASDVETLRKALAQPVTAKLTSDPTVVIVVLGYADTKGDAAANRKLSGQRAARTLEALKGPCGLMNMTHSVGMGPSELLDGKNAEANRAVEVWAVQP